MKMDTKSYRIFAWFMTVFAVLYTCDSIVYIARHLGDATVRKVVIMVLDWSVVGGIWWRVRRAQFDD